MSSGVVIRGSVEPRLEDYLVIWSRLPGMRRLVLYLVVLVVCIPLFFSLRQGFEPAVLLAIPVCLVAGGYGLYRGRTRWARSALGNSAGKTVEYVFDEQGYQTRAPDREARADWTSLHGFAETPEAFLLFVSPQLVIVIQKRALSPADQAQLLELLRARVKPQSLGSSGVKRLLVLWLVLIVAFIVIWLFLGGK
ncbi:MAG TPA: YcxB family protein [Polyangiaceae bacterium]|jgi:predicted ABC-type exoprotein transport system permease subunit|nr:YcxB family protein [Polyangiaceae bacterium]